MPFLPTSWYYPAFLIVVTFLTLFAFWGIIRSNNDRLLHDKKDSFLIFFSAFLFIFFAGLRPIFSTDFGDTTAYALYYEGMQNGSLSPREGLDGDYLWNWFMFFCSRIMSVNHFFLLVEFLYVVPIIVACKRWSKNNSSLLLLFVLGAVSFYSYGTNGIRNGMACSIVILAMTFITGNYKDKLIFIGLCVIAIGIHKSTMLPIAALCFTYLYQKPKPMFIFWGVSILVSLIAGNSVSAFFESLGFDDRLTYLSATDDASLFSHVGFRWDFLMYSFMPILLGWNVVLKHKQWDLNYLLLLGTYIYSNAFWIMVIRASYSNRFAYLSWFLYPIVLAYPLFKFDVWPHQGRKTALIMAAHFGFTVILFLL